MNKRIATIGTGAALIVAAFAASCSSTGPEACRVNGGPYAAKYTLSSVVPAGGACGDLKGELVALRRYLANGKTVIGVRASTIANLGLTGDTTGFETVSQGELVSETVNAEGFCEVTTLNQGALDLPARPGADPMDGGAIPTLPAESVSYEWRNLKILSLPNSPGEQFSADLTLVHDACTATFSVTGVAPPIGCLDEMGAEIAGACQEKGNGSNPDNVTVCDVDLGFCVLAKPPPSLPE